MKRLWVVAMAVLGMAGCFVEDGSLYATWSISESGAASTCEAVGGATVEIVSTRTWDGKTFIDKYDCVDFHGTTGDLRPGGYDVTVRLLDADGKQLNDDITVFVRVHSGTSLNLGYFDFAFGSDGPLPGGNGRFTATWVVSANGAPASCADVGAQTFEILAQSGATQKTFDFACTAGTATTELLAAGNYVVSVRLLDASGAMLNSVPVGATVSLLANQTKNLGDFDFAFSYRKASFHAHMGSAAVTGGNCAAGVGVAENAGVIEQEVRILSPTLGQCLLFDVTGGVDANAQPITTSTCVSSACQAESAAQTVNRLQNGAYRIQVLGYKGTPGGQKSVCYRSNEIAFTVNGADVDLGTIFAPFDDSTDSLHLCD